MMQSLLSGLGMVLLIVAFVVGAWLLYRATVDLAEQKQRLEDMEQALSNLTEKRRNPYLTDVGLEDTNAVLMDIQEKLDYLDARTKAARQIIGQIRRDPSAYNENEANTKRWFDFKEEK